MPDMLVPGGYRASALDIRRLSLFLAVVDSGGFTRAAEAVHISQPALSQAIAELEAELRGPLFHRLGRKVTLTETGVALVGPARAALRAIDAARQATAELSGLSHGHLDLSALPTLAADPLPELLGALHKAHPGIAVRIASPDDPAELVEHIRSGVAEVGVTDAGHASHGLTGVPFGPQRLAVVFPPGSRPPSGPLRPEQLSGVPLVLTPPGTSGRDLLDVALGQDGVKPMVAIETSQREAILPLVLAGAGAAVMPEVLAGLARTQGAVPVMLDPPLVRDLLIVCRPGSLTPPAAAFITVAEELASSRRADD